MGCVAVICRDSLILMLCNFHYLLTSLFTILPTEYARSVSRLEVIRGNQTWLYFVCLFYVVVYFVTDESCMFAFCGIRFSFFSTKPKRYGSEE